MATIHNFKYNVLEESHYSSGFQALKLKNDTHMELLMKDFLLK